MRGAPRMMISLLGACGVSCGLAWDHWSPPETVDGAPVIDAEYLGDSCYRLTLEVAPQWECSDEQIEQAQSSAPTTSSPTTSFDGAPVDGAPVEDLFADTALTLPVALEAGTCDDLVEARRASVKQANHAVVDAQYRRQLSRCLPTTETILWQRGERVNSCTRSSSQGRTGNNSGADYYEDAGSYGPAEPPAIVSDGGGASQYSTTNNQTVGVEEADYVKNDAGHIFILTGRELRIFDSWPVADAHEIARLTFEEETPRRLLLADDQLVVLLRKDGFDAQSPYGSSYGSPSAQGCTYGYDCRFQGEAGNTVVHVYDVKNPAQPLLQRSYFFAGGYVASRRIDDSVHIVVSSQSGSPPILVPAAKDLDATTNPRHAEHVKATLHHEVDRLVDELDSDELLPPALAADAGGTEGDIGCDELLEAQGADGTNMTTVVSFRLSELSRPHRTILLTQPGFVYASRDALYMATDGIDGGSYSWSVPANRDVSVIHKFALTGGKSVYRGSVPVRGHVLNQFAMDERDGVLRVATSSGWVPDPGVSSTITTVTEQNSKLIRLGELTGLAPTEDIRSVRFDDDRGFIVTFKKTDPLFAIDLSEPRHPRVLGELKIPGYSTYMHPLDRDHLLAVGFDAEDHGSFAYFAGMQVQIFDVSDMSRPQLLHKTTIGTRGSASEALLNHLAFNYFAPKKMLALPATVCEGEDLWGGTMTFSGVLVFHIDLEQGITEQGRLPFADATDDVYANAYDAGGGCYQWWSSSTSSVKRTIFFDDYLFGLSDSSIRAAHLNNLSQVVADLPLSVAPATPQDVFR